jgi:hypothetical protein
MRKLLSTLLVVSAIFLPHSSQTLAHANDSAETPLQIDWPHVVNGSGSYAATQPRTQDHLEWQILDGGVGVFQLIGWGQAATQMEHYLANTGQTLYVNPQQMLTSIPAWREQLEAQAQRMLQQAQRIDTYAAVRYASPIVLKSGWLPARVTRQENPDWYFAVGSFSYQLVLNVKMEPTLQPGRPVTAYVSMDIYVYDRYDWDEGRGTSIGGLYLANEVIGQLHRAGLAHDYDVRGTTHLNFVTVLRQDCDTCTNSAY